VFAIGSKLAKSNDHTDVNEPDMVACGYDILRIFLARMVFSSILVTEMDNGLKVPSILFGDIKCFESLYRNRRLATA
jgi:hypothetical protein